MTTTPDPLVERAVADILGGVAARIVTEHRLRPVLQRLAHELAIQTGDRLLLALRTVEQVAAELGISEQRVRALAHSRQLGWRAGRALLFTPADVDAMRERRPGWPAGRARKRLAQLENV